MNYVESDTEGEDDDEEIFNPSRRRAAKRRRAQEDSEDEFQADVAGQDSDDGMP